MGQKEAMALWGGIYGWGRGSETACGAVMWQLLCSQGWAGAGGAGGHVRGDDARRRPALPAAAVRGERGGRATDLRGEQPPWHCLLHPAAPPRR